MRQDLYTYAVDKHKVEVYSQLLALVPMFFAGVLRRTHAAVHRRCHRQCGRARHPLLRPGHPLEQARNAGEKVTDTLACAELESLLTEKLLLEQARIDSLYPDEARVEGESDRRVKVFSQQLGGMRNWRSSTASPSSRSSPISARRSATSCRWA